jgi:hypothetical protein
VDLVGSDVASDAIWAEVSNAERAAEQEASKTGASRYG